MHKLRINKDFNIRWSILTKGEAVALTGRDLRLELYPPYQDMVVLTFDIEGNTIIANISPDLQPSVGTYGLTLWENYGKDGQTAVDSCRAFTLVSSSCAEDEDIDSDVAIVETIELESGNLSLAPVVITPAYDEELDEESENAVMNKAITSEINKLKARVQVLQQGEYDSLATKDEDTLYVIVE